MTSFRRMFRVGIASELGVLVLMASLTWAGTTGKIAGVVKDADSGEPLPLANVTLKGTYLGAATDVKGRYHILSVPPGTYTLVVTMMGYTRVEVTNVRVSIDQTARVDISLRQAVLDLGTSVVVEASRPIIQKDLTTSIEVIGVDRLYQAPVSQVYEAVHLQTGVFFDPIPVEGNLSGTGRGEPRYSVRGGEQDEVVWFIDGTRSAAWAEAKADAGGSFTRINREAVKEVQVITGGFNAEYGQAQSGIVNVITKEGDQRYSWSVDYQYGPPHQRHFGTYLYDREKNIEFKRHTLVDSATGATYLDPAWWTPERQKQVYDYRAFADHQVQLSFGGPVPGKFIPLLGGELAKMTFFATARYQQEAYDLPRPRDTRNLSEFTLSGNYGVRPGLNIKFGGLYSHDAHATNGEESFPYFAKYYRGYGTLLDNYVTQLRLGVIHVLSPRLFYELKLSSYTLRQDETPSPYRVLGQSKNPDIWGWHRYDGFEDEPFLAHHFSSLAHNVTSDLAAVGNVSWQVNESNLLKTGFEFHYNTYKEDSWVLSEWSSDLRDWRCRGLNETYHPLQLAFYVQDKMEFESMILNVGVRYDLYDGNREWFTKDSFVLNPSLDPEYNPNADPDKDGIDSLGHKKWDFANVLAKPRFRVPAFHSINPRLGISFPITERSVFHFSYGHFYQMPPINAQYEFLYFRPVYVVKGQPSVDTDPERVINLTLQPLKPEKTIQFEMGFKHHFENLAVLNVTGFYKDVFDQVERARFLDKRIYGVDPYTGNESRVFYSSRYSGDYGDARGVEVSLRTLFSTDFVLDMNYSFSKSTHGTATPWQIHIDKDGKVTYQWYVEASDRLPTERSFSRPHILRANVFLRYPMGWRVPGLFQLLGNSDLSLLYTYVSGQAFTYLEPDDPPDLLDNHRMPARQQWDLRFNRYFSLGEHTFTFYTRVTNLFNQKNIKTWGLPAAFDPEAIDRFVKTGKPSLVDPDGFDISYMIYYAPRSVWVGFRYNFR
ncbi:MAG: TonB-dependent receptor [candidate division KSB1 bacterium]|nr:TonB-dependent receptor [candidate division KSB1 bacterium]